MDNTRETIVVLASIFILGSAAQWLAWRIRIPAILLLLLTGFIAGPMTGFVQPEELFGPLLLPMVSLCVGLILFEGGLNLCMIEFRKIWKPLFGLLTIGVAVTWIVATLGGVYILGLSFPVALVLGAILTVTGPTVVSPLLREIRPVGSVGAVAKWEGIMIDPVGATLALLVFEAVDSIQQAEYGSAGLSAVIGLANILVTGLILGLGMAFLLVEVIARGWVPEWLHNSVTLMFVFLAFIASEAIHHEAGLLATTAMGIAIANQKRIATHRIIEFKENLVVLLLAVLFVVLAARVSLDSIYALGWQAPVYTLLLVLVARPAAVWLSTLSPVLSNKDRWFLSWLAPRGIVAAAVSSVFALRLGDAGQAIAPVTFCVVFMTVSIYGLTSGPLARFLGVSKPNPQGFLIAGANKTARIIGRKLQELGYAVILVDTRPSRVVKSRAMGLEVHYGNILSETLLEELDLGEIGYFLAMTANDEVNTLAVARFREIFGRDAVFQLVRALPARQLQSRESELKAIDPNSWDSRLLGSELFSEALDYETLDRLFGEGRSLTQIDFDTYSRIADPKALDTKDGNKSSAASIVAEGAEIARNGNSSFKIWPLIQIDGGAIRPIGRDDKLTRKENRVFLCLANGPLPESAMTPPAVVSTAITPSPET